MRRLFATLPLLLLLGCAAQQLGVNAAPTNYVGPNLAVTDLLFQKTDFTITDINNTVYLYPGGTTASTTTGDALFDFRPYRSVVVNFYLAGLTGGTSPTAGINCYGYDQPTMPAAGYWISQVTAPKLSASGGGLHIRLGEIGALATGSGSEGQQATVGYLPMFANCQLSVSGSPTALSGVGLRVSIYGRR